MGLLGRPRLGDDVLASLREHLDALGAGSAGRVLGWASTVDGVAIGLTDRLAILRGGVWQSWPWHHLLSATWDDAGTQFAWTTNDRPYALASVVVDRPGRLPDVVAERIEQTFVVRSTVALAPGVLATLTGRRPADGHGDVEWAVVPPRGVDLRRPELAAGVQRVISHAKRDWS